MDRITRDAWRALRPSEREARLRAAGFSRGLARSLASAPIDAGEMKPHDLVRSIAEALGAAR